MNFWKLIMWFWILFAVFIVYVYFFQPEIFHTMFGAYKGAGSPFVNTPQ
jgi:hypothetical protein